jgi:hypothetical protein
MWFRRQASSKKVQGLLLKPIENPPSEIRVCFLLKIQLFLGWNSEIPVHFNLLAVATPDATVMIPRTVKKLHNKGGNAFLFRCFFKEE